MRPSFFLSFFLYDYDDEMNSASNNTYRSVANGGGVPHPQYPVYRQIYMYTMLVLLLILFQTSMICNVDFVFCRQIGGSAPPSTIFFSFDPEHLSHLIKSCIFWMLWRHTGYFEGWMIRRRFHGFPILSSAGFWSMVRIHGSVVV